MNFWEGERVRLRGIEPDDAGVFFGWNQDSDRSRHLDFLWPPTSMAQVQAWVEAQSRKKMEGDTYLWVIETLDHTPVGSIDTHDVNSHAGTFSYAIAIDEAQRGKGYASEAIQLVLRYYFTELRYQKVWVGVHENNEPSLRLHENLGFQLEGRRRRMIFHAGEYFDELYYGLTREEFTAWEARRASSPPTGSPR